MLQVKFPSKVSSFLKEYSLKLYILFLCIGSYAILKVFPYAIVPDHLQLKKVDPSDYFYLLTEITASIFGILITVVLLTFQMLKIHSHRRKDENILHSQSVSNFVSLSVFIIIGAVYSYSSIHDFTNPNNITIAYFLLYLFILFIILIFPLAILILDEVNWLRKTKKRIQQLTQKDYQEARALQFSKFRQRDNENLLFRIGGQLISSIRDNDNTAVSTILQALNGKTIDLIDDGKSRYQTSELCDGLNIVWKMGLSEALRSQNTYYFSNVWESIEEIYEFAAEKKVPLLHLQDIDMFIYEFIEFLSSNKISESLLVGSDTLYTTFKENLRNNCPPQEQLSDLYYYFEKRKKIASKIDSEMQWDYIIDHMLGHIKRIQILSIEISDKDLFVSVQRTLTRILGELNHGSFAALGQYQEAYIIFTIVSNLLWNGQKANENKLFSDTVATYQIEGSVVASFIIKGEIFSKRILGLISDFMILSQRQGQLNYWKTMNDWGCIPRHTGKEYSKNGFVRKATEFIFSSFTTLKKEIEKNQLPEQLKNYLEIKNQMNALRRTLVEDGNKKAKIIKNIDNFLDSFKEIKSAPDFKIVKWH